MRSLGGLLSLEPSFERAFLVIVAIHDCYEAPPTLGKPEMLQMKCQTLTKTLAVLISDRIIAREPPMSYRYSLPELRSAFGKTVCITPRSARGLRDRGEQQVTAVMTSKAVSLHLQTAWAHATSEGRPKDAMHFFPWGHARRSMAVRPKRELSCWQKTATKQMREIFRRPENANDGLSQP